MSLKLYYDAMSQPSRTLLIFIRHNGIPCEEIAIALRKGQHKTEEYKKIHPFQKVPAIEHNGFRLTESVAILRYLSREFSVPDHWYPKDSQRQARVDEYMAWQHLNLRMFGSMVFQHKIVIPLAKGEPPNEKSIARFSKGLEQVLGQMESVWLKENPFIAGKDLSIADLLAVTELEQPGMAGYDVFKGKPKLTAYMDRVKGALQPHYDQVHSVVYKIRQSFTDSNNIQSKL